MSAYIARPDETTATLGPSALAQISEFCSALLECASFADLQSRVLCAFETLFQCDSCGFHPRFGDSWQRDLEQFGSRGLRADFVASYLEHYYREDPFAPYIRDARGRPPWCVTLSTDVIDYRRFVTTRYYRDLMQPNRTHYSLIMVLGSRGRQTGIVVASRARHRPNFSRADRANAELIFPTLTAVLDRSIECEHLDAQAWILRTICHDLVKRPIVILDERFAPFWYNTDAERYFGSPGTADSGHGLAVPRQFLEACESLGREGDASGARSITACLDLPARRNAGRNVPVRIEQHERSGRPAYLILIGEEPGVHDAADNMRRMGLTNREIDVALLVMRGCSTPEISVMLCRSINTVESHLKSIFRKAQVSTRVGLVRKLQLHQHHAFADPGK